MHHDQLTSLTPDQLDTVIGGAGFDIGSLLGIGQKIAGAVGGEKGKQASDIMGKVAPMIQQFAGMFGKGGGGGGGGDTGATQAA
jgi:hypothetical protein